MTDRNILSKRQQLSSSARKSGFQPRRSLALLPLLSLSAPALLRSNRLAQTLQLHLVQSIGDEEELPSLPTFRVGLPWVVDERRGKDAFGLELFDEGEGKVKWVTGLGENLFG